MSARYFEAPHRYHPGADDDAIFLAGGITGCPNWQAEAAALIYLAAPEIIVLNPHRANFPIGDKTAGAEQVEWEQEHLHLFNVVTLFWFPASDPAVTTQPIAMFELGQALGEHRRMAVGADVGYPRYEDVHLLTRCAYKSLPVCDSLGSTVFDAVALIQRGR